MSETETPTFEARISLLWRVVYLSTSLICIGIVVFFLVLDREPSATYLLVVAGMVALFGFYSIEIGAIALDLRSTVTIDREGIFDRRIMHRTARWDEIERIRERRNFLRIDPKQSADWIGVKWSNPWWFFSSRFSPERNIRLRGLDKRRAEIIAAVRHYMPVDD